MDYASEGFDTCEDHHDHQEDLFDIRREMLWDREAVLFGEEECPGPDEGDGESGPPATIEPCCAKHFPHFDFSEGSDFGNDDLPF